MNFLAHFVFATRYCEPPHPQPAYVLGNALPDLLSLAEPRRRFRTAGLARCPRATPEDAALWAGVRAHLGTDDAFHPTTAFAQAQAGVKLLLRDGGFLGMRLRPFFVAHVLAELALDAALLRAEPGLAGAFYAAFTGADFAQATRWAEETLQTPLPHLPGVLTRFARARYLHSYAEDDGVAEALSRLCARARQDTFDGENFARLTAVVTASVRLLDDYAPALLTETAAKMEGRSLLRPYPPITSK